MSYAPIALFTYNRQRHLRQTVESLLQNPEARGSELFVFSDAAKNTSGIQAVDEVKRYIKQASGFAAVHIIERTENYGLARSIVEGVSQVCQEHGHVIVVEDDIVTSPFFLKFMNEALVLYERDERVISIHGYVYPLKTALPETFFLRGADCWGWATWKRGWDLFETNGQLLLQELRARKLTHRFDFDGAYPYTRMLKDQIKGENNSWAIRWYASAFLNKKFTLYPGRSLVRNIGTDSSGTHCSTTNEFTGDVADSPIKVEPISVEEDAFARQQIIRFHKAARPMMPIRVLRKLARMTRQVK
jgi:hypothetical protein